MDHLKLEMDSAWELMSRDERLMLVWIKNRILGVGRASYAPYDAAKCDRDMETEGLEELGDGCFYLWAALLKRQLRRQRIRNFASALDDVPAHSGAGGSPFPVVAPSSVQTAPPVAGEKTGIYSGSYYAGHCGTCKQPIDGREHQGCSWDDWILP